MPRDRARLTSSSTIWRPMPCRRCSARTETRRSCHLGGPARAGALLCPRPPHRPRPRRLRLHVRGSAPRRRRGRGWRSGCKPVSPTLAQPVLYQRPHGRLVIVREVTQHWPHQNRVVPTPHRSRPNLASAIRTRPTVPAVWGRPTTQMATRSVALGSGTARSPRGPGTPAAMLRAVASSSPPRPARRAPEVAHRRGVDLRCVRRRRVSGCRPGRSRRHVHHRAERRLRPHSGRRLGSARGWTRRLHPTPRRSSEGRPPHRWPPPARRRRR